MPHWHDLGDVRRLPQDLDDRMAILLPQRHEHARHQREVERHVALVAVAEVGADVGRPLVRFGEQQPIGVVAHPSRRGSASGRRASRRGSRRACPRARSGTAPRRAACRRRRDRARSASPRTTASQHRRVVEVQIRLMVEEAVPVVRAGDRRPTSSSTSRCRRR